MYSTNKTINVYNILNNQNDDYITKKYTFNNVEYMIIKYNKEKLKIYESTDIEKFKEISKYRSVVVRDSKVVAYSPGKSIDYNIFKNINQDTNNCYIEDFIDGTLFHGSSVIKTNGINIITAQINIDPVTFSFFFLLIFKVNTPPMT